MSGLKKILYSVVGLVLAGSVQAFPQLLNKPDSGQIKLKPVVHYTFGSTMAFAPQFGTFSGITMSSALSFPVNPKLTVEGGLTAGNYFSSFRGFNAEGASNPSFTNISLFGSALYHVNSQLSIFGSGYKTLMNTSPYGYFPKTRYTIGSTYNFGNFSLGATIHVSTWGNNFCPLPLYGPNRLYTPY